MITWSVSEIQASVRVATTSKKSLEIQKNALDAFKKMMNITDDNQAMKEAKEWVFGSNPAAAAEDDCPCGCGWPRSVHTFDRALAIDANIYANDPQNLPTNKEGFKQFIYLLWKGFPDIIITFEDIIVEGNKVVCRYNLAGTHKGEFMGIQPTGKHFRVNGITIFSFRDAKVVERWNLVDMTSLMEQLKT